MISFEELGLDDSLLKAVKEMGFESPTDIQEKAIPILLAGTTDFIGLAQTGTGKTAAFGLPLLQLADADKKYPQALIVCPTRELCLQICRDLNSYKKYIKGVSAEAVYGGASLSMQVRALKKGVQIVVATPGRLIDLIERKAIDLHKVEYVILDEADEMLNMGFREDIDFVLRNTPARNSIWLFSATMPKEVRSIANNFMSNPQEITVGTKNMANVNIDHQYVITAAPNRFETLKRFIDFNPGMYGLVFTRTKAGAQDVTDRLIREGYDIEALHGDLTQQQRDKVMKRFRDRKLQILVATDVAARGIDVEGITHVINFELPDDMEVYTHRSGRTARAGKHGICLSICHSRESFKIRQLEKMTKASFHKIDIPGGQEVCRKQFFYFMDKLLQADISNGAYETYLEDLTDKFKDVSKEEVLKRIAALEFDHFLKYYEHAVDLNVKAGQNTVRNREGFENKSHSSSRDQNGFTRLFINLGTKDGFYKSNFLQFILDESNLKKEVLGKIDLREMNSWVEIDDEASTKMVKSLNGKRYKGRTIRMNAADSHPARQSNFGKRNKVLRKRK